MHIPSVHIPLVHILSVHDFSGPTPQSGASVRGGTTPDLTHLGELEPASSPPNCATGGDEPLIERNGVDLNESQHPISCGVILMVLRCHMPLTPRMLKHYSVQWHCSLPLIFFVYNGNRCNDIQ